METLRGIKLPSKTPGIGPVKFAFSLPIKAIQFPNLSRKQDQRYGAEQFRPHEAQADLHAGFRDDRAAPQGAGPLPDPLAAEDQQGSEVLIRASKMLGI